MITLGNVYGQKRTRPPPNCRLVFDLEDCCVLLVGSEVLLHIRFANGAGGIFSNPLFYAGLVKPMETVQDYNFFLVLKFTHTNHAGLIFVWEIIGFLEFDGFELLLLIFVQPSNRGVIKVIEIPMLDHVIEHGCQVLVKHSHLAVKPTGEKRKGEIIGLHFFLLVELRWIHKD